MFVDGEEVLDIVIPEGVTQIPANAFNGCSFFTSVSFPNSLKEIGNNAFEECVGLCTVELPENLETIGFQSFNNCTGLKSVTFPSKITSIGGFRGCTSLVEFNIPSSVTLIQPYGFQGCSSLVSLTIPNNVLEIGYRAFDDCRSLTTITIGSGVQIIGGDYVEFGYSFGNCPNLTDVTCLCHVVPNTNKEAFNGSYIDYATLHVPATSIALYKQSEPWNQFKEIVGLNGEIVETPKCATPTISYTAGKLTFSSETEGAEFVYEIIDQDIKKGYEAEVQLSVTYNITVYATKSGCQNSDVATGTLCWIEVDPKRDGIGDGTATEVNQIPAHAVLIQSHNGMLTIDGTADGAQVSVYGIDGTLAGSAVSQNGYAIVRTDLHPSSVAIVKIGNRSVKVLMK